jgi:hypothetical protein
VGHIDPIVYITAMAMTTESVGCAVTAISSHSRTLSRGLGNRERIEVLMMAARKDLKNTNNDAYAECSVCLW